MTTASARSAWVPPPSRPSATRSREPAVAQTPERSGIEAAFKLAFVFALVAWALLDRFGLRINAMFSVHPALIATYVMVVLMLLTRSVRIDPGIALLYAVGVTIGALSFMVNASFALHQSATVNSLMLVVVLYAPFALSVRPEVGTPELWHWAMRMFVGFAVACAVIGIFQFYAQFFVTAPWLFDWRSFIPEAIRGSGLYNTVNRLGAQEIVKSNGFFMREPAFFSVFMGIALICEWNHPRRKWVLGVLSLGLLVSYSGSGLLAIAVAMLFPLGLGTLLRVAVVGAICATVYLLLGDVLNLDYTVARVGEFQLQSSAESSAYCRFILPGKIAVGQMDSEFWTAFLGHGPGTMQKLHDSCETTYGKLIFEYGLLGTLAFLALMLAVLNRSAAPVRIRVALGVNWLLLGSLVGPEPLLLAFLFSSMWPDGLLSQERTSREREAKGDKADAGGRGGLRFWASRATCPLPARRSKPEVSR